ncbi:hypothetical protein M0R45_036780 [Rubus argutus]|uniref:MADS-box domain-containing protein n=1 Tax=Rubus argutus TaxID=59490 RepID=A0AAW1VZT5_RUBAR
MELLPNQGSCKKMYRDRKLNILKKAEELAILCGIDVCVIMFQPSDKKTSTTTQPAPAAETWPQNPTQVNRIIRKYKTMLPATTNSPPSSTAPLAIKDTIPSSSSSSSSPSQNIPERNNINLDLSLSLPGSYDSNIKCLDKGKRKLHAADAGKDELYDHKLIRFDEQEAKLASLEAKQQAITDGIASLEANHV